MEAFREKILGLKIDVKVLEFKMGEMEVVSETILGWKIGLKNSKMENQCKNTGSVEKFQLGKQA